MKLALVISSLTSGGAERVLSILANSWAERGWQITLITTHDDGNPPFYPLNEGVDFRPILLSDIPGGGISSNLRRTRRLRRILASVGPDGIVSFLNFTNIMVLTASIGLKIPVVVSERLDPRVHRLSRSWEFLRRWLYPRAALLVNQTEAAAAWFQDLMGDRIVVIPNPVNVPVFSEEVPEISLESPSVVAMGRLHRQKGFATLIEAMAIVHRSDPSVHLTILGEGGLREDLENLRDRLGLRAVVHLPGRVKRPYDVLKQAQVFVLSSVTEGFPNVLSEAMAVGLPVVATDCPSGPAELIRSGHNGLLVPVGDPEALASAILRFLKDREFSHAAGRQASTIVDRFSLESVLGMWDSALDAAGVNPVHSE